MGSIEGLIFVSVFLARLRLIPPISLITHIEAFNLKRRTLIKSSAAAISASLIPNSALLAAISRKDMCQLSSPLEFAKGKSSYWLGPDFWGNRLQDWRFDNNRIECIRANKNFEMRTVSLLTRFLEAGDKPGRLQMTVGCIDPDKPGFCGFLLGVGKGELDYRGCALAQRASGTNGGFMAVLSSKGQLEFRDFTRNDKPLAFDQLQRTASEPMGDVGKRRIVLDCHLDPVGSGLFDVRLVASDAETKKELAFAVRTGVPADELRGGVMLLSSPPSGMNGARWWFDNISTGGDKIAEYPERSLGPVLGCLHSVNVDVLKLTAQFMPIDLSPNNRVQLQYKLAKDKKWKQGPLAEIEDGYIAAFRIEKWDASKTWDYRVVMDGSDDSLYTGQVRRDPGKSKALNIALFSCITPTSRNLEAGVYTKFVPQERDLGRYTHDNIVFPHKDLVGHCESHEPDMYVFCGDQFYEANPTRWWANHADTKIDTLYRWYLFLWTFRDSVRDKPAIILIDDHDVLQGNLWGQAGLDSEGDREEDGGYRWDKEVVRMVHRIENSHNPDAYDATPIEHDIPVTYGAFRYGGISFGVLEDRKFKSPPNTKRPFETQTGELLGKRQEEFLRAWKTMHKGYEKIVISASSWVCAQTTSSMKPVVDFDSNGYPPLARTRAVELVNEVSNLILAGDQHLAMLKQLGIKEFDDGPVQFCGPAGGVFWQRWFEVAGQLDNKRNNDPNTGNFTDAFGNKVRILAVANPKISYKEYLKHVSNGMQFMSDPKLKSEGYGVIRVNHEKKHFDIECWPWEANPKTDKQYAGWPFRLNFKREV